MTETVRVIALHAMTLVNPSITIPSSGALLCNPCTAGTFSAQSGHTDTVFLRVSMYSLIPPPSSGSSYPSLAPFLFLSLSQYSCAQTFAIFIIIMHNKGRWHLCVTFRTDSRMPHYDCHSWRDYIVMIPQIQLKMVRHSDSTSRQSKQLSRNGIMPLNHQKIKIPFCAGASFCNLCSAGTYSTGSGYI